MAALTLVATPDPEQPDYSGSAMVALYPPRAVAEKFALEGGMPVDKMHMTLVYLGEAKDVDPKAALKVVRKLAQRAAPVIHLGGLGRFTDVEDGTDVIVVLADSPDLEQLRRDAIDGGLKSASEHGFTGHMSLMYIPADAPFPVQRLEHVHSEFPVISLVHGNDRTDFLFQAPDDAMEVIRSYARTAYAQGWAASGGPMTDTVMAGCIAAMDLCQENAHDPNILEVAIHLGRLEGVWAKVFERRFKMMGNFTTLLTALWRKALAKADVAGTVSILRQQFGLMEDSKDEADKLRRAKAAARELAMRILTWLPATAEWQDMRDAMRQLIASGRAEGYADAVDIAAADQHLLGYDFEIAFQHAYDAIANLGDVWAESDTWLQKMLGRAADQFGRTLGELAAAGASYQDMVDAATAALDMTAEDADAVEFTVDWALSAGFARGALDLYRSENVEYVTWMTAGDDRVCPVCEKNGADSPFLISDFPDMPAHPRCRCVPSAEFTVSPEYSGFFS